MKLITDLKTLNKVSPFYNEWDGKQKSKIKTSSTNQRYFVEYGQNSKLTVKDIKNLYTYEENDILKDLLNRGLMFDYQVFTITIQGQTARPTITWRNTTTGDFSSYRLTQKDLLNARKNTANKKIIDMLLSLYREFLAKGFINV